MRISAIIVTYFSEKELPVLLSSFVSQQGFKASELEIIIINNGGKLPDLTAYELNIQVHHQPQNLGYAKAINLGVKYSQGDFFIFMNPDITLRQDCVIQLMAGLKQFDIVGPLCFLDKDHSILLPSTESTGYAYRLVKGLSRTYYWMAKKLHKMWFRANIHAITAENTFPNFQLSGAMLATSCRAWDQVGPFDEGFQLYYEENDWLKRSQQKGLTAGQIPAAKIHHTFNQSAKKEPQVQAWFQASAAYFFSKHYHPLLNKLIQKVASGKMKTVFPSHAYHIRIKETESSSFIPITFTLPLNTLTGVIETSISPLFVPSALMLVESQGISQWKLPPEVWDNFQEGQYYFRVIGND